MRQSVGGVCRIAQRYRSGTVPLSLRRGLAAAAAAAALLIAADAANAQFFGIFGPPRRNSYDYYYYSRPRPAAPDPYYFKPKRQPVVAPKKEPAVKPPPGPLLIAIALNRQRLTLYSSGAPISHAPVSTGTATHPTPTGIFSVIGKERFHRSNLYSNAPMPFMQRITWSGVALHQGVLPGYPASHGCIRLPGNFAQYLWGTTRMGARVIITRDEVAPFDIAHARLFVPKPSADEIPTDEVQATGSLKLAESDDPVKSSDMPKPTLVGTTEEDARDIATKGALGAPGAASKSPAPAAAKKTAGAPESNVVVDARAPSPPPDGALSAAAADDVIKPGRAATAEVKEKPRMSEPVSVFVSRKAGRLYVRQGFEPLFDVPVTIRDPEVPLGTHLYTAMEFNEDRTALRWVAVSLSDQASATEPERRQAVKKKAKDEPVRAPHVPAAARLAAAAALDRLDMPQHAVDRISDLLSPGASLIVSDYPLSHETGKYTDFIILTKY